jgi:hypothetical protein
MVHGHRGKAPCTVELGTLTEMSDHAHILAALTLRKGVPVNYWIGGGADPKDGLDVVTRRNTCAPARKCILVNQSIATFFTD